MLIKETRFLKWALNCNVIYVLLLFLFSPDGINIANIFITSLLILSVIMILIYCYKNRNLLKNLSKSTRALLYILLFWGLIVVIRSFSQSIQDWATNFGNIYMAYAWLLPLTMLLGLKIENWKVVEKSMSFMFNIMILAFLAYLSLPFLHLNEEWIQLLRPINLLLLLGWYHFGCLSKLKAYSIVAIYLYIAFLGSRRLEFIFLGLVVFLLIIDKLKHVKLKKYLIKYILIIFVLVFTVIFTFGYEHVANAVALLIEYQDSRTFLFKEFMKDLSMSEKIFGKGSLGTYYSEYMAHTRWYVVEILKQEWWGDSETRITVEVGYLQMILKGGFIILFLNVLFLIRSIYLGIFKSNNKFIKRLSYYVLCIALLSLIELRPTFTPTFIFLWMAIGTISAKKYRMMTNSEVNSMLV